uniref:UEV domain-containing protein n=1 Tax=Steinernema glaseri TaxID=37863 RepID=A0A1I7XWL7_9BILA
MTADMSLEALLKKAKAKHPETVRTDVSATRSVFQELAPSVQTFTFPGKKSSSTFVLSGTIPVSYKGARYHIPVAVYIPSKYPQVAPVCLVKPTSEMRIKVSPIVDDSGRINIPYLSSWRSPGYHLCGLVKAMTQAFGEMCPVYSIATTPGPSVISRFPTYVNVPPPKPMESNTSTIKPEHLKASLVSAIEYEVRRRLMERLGVHFAEIESMKETMVLLQEGGMKVRSAIEELEVKATQMEDNAEIYREKRDELTKKLHESSSSSNSIDSVIEAATPVHRQIVDCISADLAIDDAIYALGRAVKEGRVDVQTYLRLVRQLSRKQFVHRALLRKCRIVATLM